MKKKLTEIGDILQNEKSTFSSWKIINFPPNLLSHNEKCHCYYHSKKKTPQQYEKLLNGTCLSLCVMNIQLEEAIEIEEYKCSLVELYPIPFHSNHIENREKLSFSKFESWSHHIIPTDKLQGMKTSSTFFSAS